MSVPAPRFALIGAAGFVAPRHLMAIRDVGGKLVAALDTHDAAGILDRFDMQTEFFVEPERFERYLHKLRRGRNGIQWLSICSPNYLHDAHVRMGLHVGADVICEKPLTLTTQNHDTLVEDERETGHQVFTVLQLRLHPGMQALKAQLEADPSYRIVNLQYTTPRGHWYHRSWKGNAEKSGGLITNIGVHMLDVLLWLFGPVKEVVNVVQTAEHCEGRFLLERATVNWSLAVCGPPARALTISGIPDPINFNDGFADLHTAVYREILAGRGYGINDARPAIALAQELRK